MLRGTMLVDSPEVEATRSESPPDSNAERKRALTVLESSEARASPQRFGRKKSPKRAKPSEQGGEGGVGISPHTRTQASVAEAPPRGSQHGEFSTAPYNYCEPIIFNAFVFILTSLSSSYSSIKLVWVKQTSPPPLHYKVPLTMVWLRLLEPVIWTASACCCRNSWRRRIRATLVSWAHTNSPVIPILNGVQLLP
jgi:hypothetical protein